jgi:hypothetical protein
MSEIAAELMGKIKGGQGMQDEEGDLEDEEESVSTEVEDSEETESEDVIQTIITRTKQVSLLVLHLGCC